MNRIAPRPSSSSPRSLGSPTLSELDDVFDAASSDGIEIVPGQLGSQFDELLATSPLDALIDHATSPSVAGRLASPHFRFDSAIADLGVALAASPVQECRWAADVVRESGAMLDLVGLYRRLYVPG